MTVEFKLPLISEGVEAADIAAVHVHEGDMVEAGQIVLEVETEKAVAEIPSPQAGRIGKILVKPGQTVKIGELLLTIDETGRVGGETKSAAAAPRAGREDSRLQKPAAEPRRLPASEAKQRPAAAAATKLSRCRSPRGGTRAPNCAEAPTQNRRRRRPSSPRGRLPTTTDTKRRPYRPGRPHGAWPASWASICIAFRAAGPGGRITTDDVQAFVRSLTTGRRSTSVGPMAGMALPPFDRFGPIERQPMNKLARVSAANLTVAWQTVPHVTQHELADVTELEEARQSYMKTIGQNGPKVTMTAIMVKAVVGALKAFPNFNSSIDLAPGELVIKRYYHIGVAVDTEYGLLVPVIRDADRKTVLTIAGELGEPGRTRPAIASSTWPTCRGARSRSRISAASAGRPSRPS